MAMYGVSIVLSIVAWDLSANDYKTGDAANITLYWLKDGVDTQTTNACAEVDATNQKGVYKVTLTATEAQCLVGTLGGKSSTANIRIIPVTVSFDQLPNVTPGGASGLALVGSNVGAAASVTADVGITQAGADKVWSTAARALTDKTGFTLLDGSITTAKFAVGAIDSTVLSTNAKTAIATAVGALAVDGAYTIAQMCQIAMGVLAGKLSGAGTGTITIRDVGDTRNLIVAITDASGNRSSITLTLV